MDYIFITLIFVSALIGRILMGKSIKYVNDNNINPNKISSKIYLIKHPELLNEKGRDLRNNSYYFFFISVFITIVFLIIKSFSSI